jgi:DNA-directed RNA polymerase subunit D
MVEIKVLERDKDQFASDNKTSTLKLLIKGETHQFLNVLRRIIQEEVKTLAIEDVYVIENSSALWDEFIAHRLGLIVLNTPEKLSYGDEVKLTLEKEGKGYVYASDIKSENKDVYPVYPETPIAYLEEGQRIKLSLVAKFGNGREHAKWIPAHVYYYRLADVKIKGKLTNDDKKTLEELGVKVEKNKIKLPKEKENDRTLIDAIESALKDKVEVIPKDEFVFVVESFGQYSAEKVVLLGLEELKIKLKNLLNSLI